MECATAMFNSLNSTSTISCTKNVLNWFIKELKFDANQLTSCVKFAMKKVKKMTANQADA